MGGRRGWQLLRGPIVVATLAVAALSPPAAGHTVFKRPVCVSPTVLTPDGHCCPPNQDFSTACGRCVSLPALTAVCKSGKSPAPCLEAGEMFNNGRLRAPARAADMFEKACNRGSAVACVRLAHIYEEGIGRSPNPARTERLYDEACAGELRCACIVLGVALSQPERNGRDARRGAGLLSRACDAGDPDACRWLARRYREGHGVERSDEKATALRDRACAAKVRDACDGVDPVNPREVMFRFVDCRPGRVAHCPG